MNEKEGRPDPDDKEKEPPESRPAAAVPARAQAPGADSTGPGAAPAGAAGGVDATIGLEPTESYAPAGSGSGGESSPTPATLAMPAHKPPSPKEGQVIANRFVVHRMLGQGGMGRVYAVQDRQIEGRDVALKVLLPKYSKNTQFRKLFFQEVRAAQEFVSEYICQVRDTGETEDGSLFFTMDMVEGESLRALLDREKILGPRQALEITRQVLLGLHSGHEKGYVHRDIKPSNVMLAARVAKTDTNPYGVGVRLLDFGIAGLATEIDERSRAGTVMYMSPEQASGERLDPRSDLFAVGVLLFEMLSGHRPFDGSTTRALVQSVLETNLTARLGEIPNLSKPVRKLLERALQKDRNKRFQSATDFADEIAKSAAYKLPQNVPGWVYAALAVALVAAVGEAVVVAGKSSEIKTLETAANNFEGRLSQEVLRVQEEKDKVIEERAKRIAEVESKLGTTTAVLETARKELADVKAEFEGTKSTKEAQQKLDEERQREAERRELALQKQIDEVKQQVADLQKEKDRLQAERDEARLQASGKGQVAMAFDKLADLLERGFGVGARKTLEQYESEAVFAKEGQLHEFLTAIVAATEHIETHLKSMRDGQGPRRSEVRAAEKALIPARDGFDAFAAGAGEWKDVEFPDQPPQERLDRARSLLDLLASKVEQELLTSGAEDASAWTAMSFENLGQDPKAVLNHYERFGCPEHLADAAARLVASLRKQAAPGPALDLAALRRFRGLEDWVDRLEKRQFELEVQEAVDLRLFDLALRWYDSNPANDKFEWSGIALSAVNAESSSWKHVLRLQQALAQAGSAYPSLIGGRSLSRQLDDNNGVVSWIEDKDESRPGVPNQWEIRRSFADSSGKFRPGQMPLSFERVGDSIRVKGATEDKLKLKALNSGVRVAPLPRLIDDPVPPSLLSSNELDSFRKDYAAAAGELCLVVEERNTTRWFSPRFGLVQETIPGSWTQNLVYWAGSR